MNDVIPNFDDAEVDEYEEVQDALARYEDSAAKLLDAVARRDEMVALLKIAQPSKIAEVRECIAGWNALIEKAEELMEGNALLLEKARDLARHCLELEATCDLIEPQLIAHIAKNAPEKLELAKAILSDDGKSH